MKQLTQEEMAKRYQAQLDRLKEWASYAGKASANNMTEKQLKERAIKASHSTKRYRMAHKSLSSNQLDGIVLPT